MAKYINEYSLDELREEIAKREQAEKDKKHVKNLSPFGTWRVTTNGDCEGKTTKQLGTFKGHIVDIAKHLAGKEEYSLNFTPVFEDINIVQKIESKRKSVAIQLDISSGTWDMSKTDRVNAVGNMLKCGVSYNGWRVEPCNYYAAVTVVFDD